MAKYVRYSPHALPMPKNMYLASLELAKRSLITDGAFDNIEDALVALAQRMYDPALSLELNLLDLNKLLTVEMNYPGFYTDKKSVYPDSFIKNPVKYIKVWLYNRKGRKILNAYNKNPSGDNQLDTLVRGLFKLVGPVKTIEKIKELVKRKT